jgi:diguanylate cyclase (GGDEF)-like protein
MMTWLKRWFSPTRKAPITMPDAVIAERNVVLTALLTTIADLSQAHTHDPNAIIQGICNSIVNASPHIKLAWAWFGDTDATAIRPLIYAGPAAAYAETLSIPRNGYTVKGPAFSALLTDKPDYRGVSRFSLFGPWRRAVIEHGFEVAVAFPLKCANPQMRGILVFYADDQHYFEAIGLAPFEALARVAEAALVQANLRIQLESWANTDALTGLHNRRYMEDTLARMRASHARHGHAYSLLLIDIDHFKKINDRYGHTVGDMVLRQAATIMHQQLREEDLVARWGGEEFLCAAPNCTAEEAATLAERIRQAIAQHSFILDEVSIKLSISIGITTASQAGESVTQLFQKVDQALYQAKAEGRDRVVTWSDITAPPPAAHAVSATAATAG